MQFKLYKLIIKIMASKWNVIKNILKKDNLIRWNLYFDDKYKAPNFYFLKKISRLPDCVVIGTNSRIFGPQNDTDLVP